MVSTTIPTEHEEQRELVRRFRQQFPDVRIFAIPNGGHRNLKVAAKLKAEGVAAGAPDLYVPEWHLWIEMKRRSGGRVSPAQSDWHDYLRGIGDTVIVAAGADAAMEAITALRKK